MKALDTINLMLERCASDMSSIPPTVLYNEGWMLRLILEWFSKLSVSGHPLAFSEGARWYSEALIPSAFLSRKNKFSEQWTHADGVIGHFVIGNGAKGNLTLNSDAKHFVVLEAKMFSKLSAGVKNADYFNQAARYVACIAEVLKLAGRQAQEFKALGFYVLAPTSQIEKGLFDEHLTKDSLRTVVEQRVEEYGAKRDWFAQWFLPVLERLDIKTISWENLIDFLADRDPDAGQLKDFYKSCLEFNKPSRKGQVNKV
ncbi:MAG: hypothetical protein WCH07_09075 [Deltaproteobacteria bacterium]